MTDDLSIMLAAIEANPAELTAYGGIADIFEERGALDHAHAYRWCMQREKWPHMRTHYVIRRVGLKVLTRSVAAKHRWAWYGQDNYPLRFVRGELLPPGNGIAHMLPFLVMPGVDQKVFSTHAKAMSMLAEALAKVGQVYSLRAA